MSQFKKVITDINELDQVKDTLKRLPISENAPYVVAVYPWKKSRSLAQNNLFHMWVSVMANETGNDEETVKTELKRMFLGFKMVEFKNHRTGEVNVCSILRGSSDLSVSDMSVFMNKVQAWAATDMGITLPTPEDLMWSIQGESP